MSRLLGLDPSTPIFAGRMTHRLTGTITAPFLKELPPPDILAKTGAFVQGSIITGLGDHRSAEGKRSLDLLRSLTAYGVFEVYRHCSISGLELSR
jgi:hypothetical protein